MQAIIRFQDGRRVEVLVAAVGRFTMRIIAPNGGDFMELRSEYGQWVDESGAPLEFEAFLATGAADCAIAAHAAEIQPTS